MVDVTNPKYDSLMRNRINNLQFTGKLFTIKLKTYHASIVQERCKLLVNIPDVVVAFIKAIC